MGSPDGQDSSEGKSQGAARKANSQRPSFSCLECARRVSCYCAADAALLELTTF